MNPSARPAFVQPPNSSAGSGIRLPPPPFSHGPPCSSQENNYNSEPFMARFRGVPAGFPPRHFGQNPFPPPPEHCPSQPPFERPQSFQFNPRKQHPFPPRNDDSNGDHNEMFAGPNNRWVNQGPQNGNPRKRQFHKRGRKSKNSSAWEPLGEHGNKDKTMGQKAQNPQHSKSCEVNFFCDTCDKGFTQKEKMDEHLRQHVTCGRDGCTFEAHGKIVELHIKLQHDSGYASHIMQLTNPEEIKKWREQRKKNFPLAGTPKKGFAPRTESHDTTEKRSQRRGQQRKQHRKSFPKRRGNQQFPHSSFGQEHADRRSSFRGRGRAHRGRGGRPLSSPRPVAMEDVKDGLKKFAGMHTLLTGEGDPSPDNEIMAFESTQLKEYVKPPSKVVRQPGADPLSFVLSDSGDSDDAPLEIKNIKGEAAVEDKPTLGGGLGLLMNMYASETENEAEKSAPPEQIVSNKPRGYENRAPLLRRTKLDNAKKRPFRKHQLSLLQKLIAREIQHERNVVIQCVQYVVNNDFFGLKNSNLTDLMPR